MLSRDGIVKDEELERSRDDEEIGELATQKHLEDIV